MDKRRLGDLALFGGERLFAETRHVGRPNIGSRDRFIGRVGDILDRRWLTNNGPYVIEFEERIAAVCDVPHAIAVCNATIGLELLVRGLELTGEVIVPSFTFVATAHALQWLGLTPVFCDVDPHTHTIDPDQTEQLFTSNTSAILGVHVWGRACHVDRLQKIADRHHVRLIFDAAHAFGSSHLGRPLGSFGDAEVFSFHATKFLNSFEGGAITTTDAALAARLRKMRNFGFAGLDNVVDSGTNGKMTEISAAMGLTSLESMDLFIGVNRENYLTYKRELSGVAALKLYDLPNNDRANYQYVVVELDTVQTPLSRNLLIEILVAEGVEARRYFYPGVHEMEPYRSTSPGLSERLTQTEQLTRSVLQLPTGMAMSTSDIAQIGQLIRFAFANAREIVAARALEKRAS